MMNLEYFHNILKAENFTREGDDNLVAELTWDVVAEFGHPCY